MNDLGLNLECVRTWFPHEQDSPYVLVRVSDDHAQGLSDAIGIAVRRCYITDPLLVDGRTRPNVSEYKIIAAKLPDPGATMAGDFGEILVYLYQGTREHATTPIGATKWRLKHDRTKSAPYSDVIHFVLPTWPDPSAEDVILCAEVKTKSTASGFRPIPAAIAGILKDRTSRLAKTLVWLRERALTEDLGDVQLEHLERFLNATDHPAPQRRFCAVAVVSADLVEAELAAAPVEAPTTYTVAVIAVPQLRAVYTSVFAAASHATVPAEGGDCRLGVT